MTSRQWIGATVGIVGIVVAIGLDIDVAMAPHWALVLPVLGMLSLSTATLLAARVPARCGPIPVLALHCVVAAAASAIAVVWQGGPLGAAGSQFWVALAWLVAGEGNRTPTTSLGTAPVGWQAGASRAAPCR